MHSITTVTNSPLLLLPVGWCFRMPGGRTCRAKGAKGDDAVLGDNAVQEAMIADGAVTDAKISGVISGAKIGVGGNYKRLEPGFGYQVLSNTFYLSFKCSDSEKSDYAKADDLMLSVIFFPNKI